jgi:DNA invertase Pin-like site-specific DNA recombinase
MNYGYARTSTFDQQYGLEDQIVQLTKVGCNRVFSEQVSATDMEARTEWAKLMDGLKAGDIVTITKIDRAARNIADMVAITQALDKIGASIRILDMNIDTDTPTGKLMLNIFARYRSCEGQGQNLAFGRALVPRSEAHRTREGCKRACSTGRRP